MLPLLAEPWPGAGASLARAARGLAQAAEVYAERASEDLVCCSGRDPFGQPFLALGPWRGLSAARANAVLRAWLQAQGAGMVSEQSLATLLGQVIAARADRQPALVLGRVEIRRYRERLYALRSRRSGELLIGATVEHAGFERLVTPEAVERLIAAAVALVPDLAGRPMLRAWRGFRPWAEDSQPVLGPWPGVSGLYVATGHFRNGILLAPVTGALMAQTILEGSISKLMRPFLPDRFLQEGAPR